MIRYTIFANEGGLACKRIIDSEEPSFLVTSREFNEMITNFTQRGYKVKINGNNLILSGNGESIVLRDYDSIKDNILLTKLKSDIETTVRRDGFIDVTRKKSLSGRINRAKSNAIALVAVGVVLLGTVLAGAQITSATSAGDPDINVETEIEKNKAKKDTIEISPVALAEQEQTTTVYYEMPPIEEVEIEENFMPVVAKSCTIEFPDNSKTERAKISRERYYATFEECAKLYGLDAEMLLGIGTQEWGINSNDIDTCVSIGLMQIKYSVWHDKDVTYYRLNENTGEFEKKSLKITDELLLDPYWNIHIGAIIVQNYLIYDKYNIPQAIQSNNQGIGAVDDIVSAYCSVTSKDFNAVRSDPTDIGWLDYRYLKAGDPKYLENVNMWLSDHTFTVTNVFTKEQVSFEFKNGLEKTQLY
ncbi:MAG TPA: hypothetical protein DCY94_02675 [Firmicutes bacterium]|nr:hypothetical protein [Bacillota bacterium]